MLDALNFVKGAVARKDFVPSLTHFHIRDGRVWGYNGRIALSSPISMDLACSPKATSFIKVAQTCKETTELHMAKNGKLAVRSGKFSAYVDCLETEDAPNIAPEGEEVRVSGKLLDAIRDLGPFIAQDASRKWARGILFRRQSAFATNNIIAVERWLGYPIPIPINVPEEAVDELVRIGEEPERLQIAENSIAFHFSGGRWLRSQLLTTSWPEVDRILDRSSSREAKLPDGTFAAVRDLLPFVGDDERLWISDGRVSTVMEGDEGASVEVPGLTGKSCFHIKQFLNLESVLKIIDLTMYPDPCIFFGTNIRGAIVGMLP